jgi:cell volume regulation protein A
VEASHHLILLGSALVLLSIFAGVFSARFRAPLLLVFLGLGILAGEEGPGGILFRDFHAAYLIGSIALAIMAGYAPIQRMSDGRSGRLSSLPRSA